MTELCIPLPDDAMIGTFLSYWWAFAAGYVLCFVVGLMARGGMR